MGRTACTEPQCLYNGALYLYLLVINMRYAYQLHGKRTVLSNGCQLEYYLPEQNLLSATKDLFARLIICNQDL
jgi:hypothetical protein